MIEALAVIGVLLLVYLAFAVSASAGLGGSLVMVPTLSLFLGSKEGVALAALLLASNNVFKIWAYRKTLPFRAAAVIVVMIVIGAAIGSSLLVRAPDAVVTVAIGGFGLWNLKQAKDSMETVYQDRVVPLEQLDGLG